MDAGIVIPTLAVIALAYLLGPSVLVALSGARKPRRVTCPDNQQLVEIKLSAGQATKRLFTDCRHGVGGCTRWPEKAGCDEACTIGLA